MAANFSRGLVEVILENDYNRQAGSGGWMAQCRTVPCHHIWTEHGWIPWLKYNERVSFLSDLPATIEVRKGALLLIL